jgi:hypothetical protein
LCKDKELTLSKTEYSGQELRTDGFYYGRPVEDYQGVTFYELFVFYKNGILMLPGNIEFEKMEEYITMISRPGTIEAKYGWGLFNVEGGIISLEHWVAAQCGYPAVLRSGEILNDTTFVLKKRIIRDSQGTTETDVNEEFHFREFDVKPDSTNNFIK